MSRDESYRCDICGEKFSHFSERNAKLFGCKFQYSAYEWKQWKQGSIAESGKHICVRCVRSVVKMFNEDRDPSNVCRATPTEFLKKPASESEVKP